MKILKWKISSKTQSYFQQVKEKIDKPLKIKYIVENSSYSNFRATGGYNPSSSHALLQINRNLELPKEQFGALIAHELTHILFTYKGFWQINEANTLIHGPLIIALQDPPTNQTIEKHGFNYEPLFKEEALEVLKHVKNRTYPTNHTNKNERFLLYVLKIILQEYCPTIQHEIKNKLSRNSFSFYYKIMKFYDYISDFTLTKPNHYNHCLVWMKSKLESDVDILFINNKGKKISKSKLDFILSIDNNCK